MQLSASGRDSLGEMPGYNDLVLFRIPMCSWGPRFWSFANCSLILTNALSWFDQHLDCLGVRRQRTRSGLFQSYYMIQEVLREGASYGFKHSYSTTTSTICIHTWGQRGESKAKAKKECSRGRYSSNESISSSNSCTWCWSWSLLLLFAWLFLWLKLIISSRI